MVRGHAIVGLILRVLDLLEGTTLPAFSLRQTQTPNSNPNVGVGTNTTIIPYHSLLNLTENIPRNPILVKKLEP